MIDLRGLYKKDFLKGDFMGIKLINPTGLGIRIDKQGSGLWGSPRGSRRHAGTDFICIPGQNVFSPIDGKVVRVAYPYADDMSYRGIILRNNDIVIRMYYFEPLTPLTKPGVDVIAGDVIGHAQDISKRYPSEDKPMTPHVHLQIDGINPERLVTLV